MVIQQDSQMHLRLDLPGGVLHPNNISSASHQRRAQRVRYNWSSMINQARSTRASPKLEMGFLWHSIKSVTKLQAELEDLRVVATHDCSVVVGVVIGEHKDIVGHESHLA
jgi:hypothetical protein